MICPAQVVWSFQSAVQYAGGTLF